MPKADYLATHYLTASTASKPKKRKRNPVETTDTTIIEDDPAFPPTHTANSDDETPLIVGGQPQRTAKFKRSNFKTVSFANGGISAANGSGATAAETGNGDAEGDALIAAAAQEQRDRAAADEDAPVVAENGEDEETRMASGAKAGLQSAAQVSADLKRRQKAERKRLAASMGADGKGGETIYRDASGRVVSVSAARAEARRAEDEKAAKAEADKAALRGEVQSAQAEERRRELAKMGKTGFARGVEDEEMNAELKGRERWGDVMVGMIADKRDGEGAVGVGSGGGKGKRKKTYKGGFEANRYGIAPGHRWDGVDRGNGFERKWWAARNERGRNERLKVQWEFDV